MTRHHRRCTLCYTEYTPQWRRSRHTGGYLCNACGTRELREAQKMPGFQSRRLKKRTSYGDLQRTPTKKSPTSYERQFAYSNLLCDSSAYKDVEMMVTPMSSSGTTTTSSTSGNSSCVSTDHANHEVFATWMVMMRFESDVRRADEMVHAHPCYSGLSALQNLEPNMECDNQHSHQVKHLLENAVSLSRAVNQHGPINMQRIEGMKSQYRTALDDLLCKESL